MVARDPDQDPLTYSLAYGPAGLAVERCRAGSSGPRGNRDRRGLRRCPRRRRRGGTLAPAAHDHGGQFNDAPVFVSEPVRVARIPGVYSYDADAQDPLRPTEPMARYWLDPSAAPPARAINEASGLIEWTIPVLGLYDVVVWAADQDGESAWQHYRLPSPTSRPTSRPCSTRWSK